MTHVVRQRKDKAAELLASGEVEAALSEYQKVVEEVPEDLTSRRMVAELFQRLGRRKDALATYEVLADAWARRGWMLRAMALCKIILQIEPRHERTQRLLAELYSRRQTPPLLLAPTPVSAPSDPVAVVSQPGTGKVPRFPIFSQLSGDAFLSLLEGLEMRFFQPGDIVIDEGTVCTSMFVIVEGSVEVVQKLEQGGERSVALMGEGNLFGEMVLAAEGPGRARIKAYEPTVVLELTRVRVEQLIMRYPAVGQVLQTFHRERMLGQMMSNSPLFRPLSQVQRQAVALEFQLCSLPADRPLIAQGRAVDALYVLLRGRCRVTHHRSDGGELACQPLQEGDMFGEIALLLGTSATATVVTDTECTLLRLSRDACERHLLSQPGLRDYLSHMASERLERTARLMAGDEAANDDVYG
ncbi:cyclic nucleotide-binding domain-containing protein [Hyalangium sp.]|uniref:cyclic nucleotide-binding domain-containing protein n=1 Tax=Hyalangium sp. TaxID=2028555 RepID=UPI002D35D143|nr:cyclic nucleotide-binding domain-containing protein [Hyalangium sp.]HYI02133.1 cyclic nucleotide-binding domain-containing protein [Hyalangium sp.]